ncbi:hypothetical protein GCM10023321_39110 [Pseudonocardia eucalypti]|uniref:Uncharacterized protein n=1 Tax=Pseudonocardia eucalypti TaxID=648755 RepID=A0ABP9Q9C9_9PSEU|nr:hypothetical protein [Pseudonocardia eucalypti]
MNLKKLVGFLVVIFVLFWIISQPGNASGTVNNLLANLRDAGESLVTFIGGVF